MHHLKKQIRTVGILVPCLFLSTWIWEGRKHDFESAYSFKTSTLFHDCGLQKRDKSHLKDNRKDCAYCGFPESVFFFSLESP